MHAKDQRNRPEFRQSIAVNGLQLLNHYADASASTLAQQLAMSHTCFRASNCPNIITIHALVHIIVRTYMFWAAHSNVHCLN